MQLPNKGSSAESTTVMPISLLLEWNQAQCKTVLDGPKLNTYRNHQREAEKSKLKTSITIKPMTPSYIHKLYYPSYYISECIQEPSFWSHTLSTILQTSTRCSIRYKTQNPIISCYEYKLLAPVEIAATQKQ